MDDIFIFFAYLDDIFGHKPRLCALVLAALDDHLALWLRFKHNRGP